MRIRLRIVALVLLAVIALDIPDASCDPLEIPDDRPVFSSSPGHDDDPCSACCVPDCFCCSSTHLAVLVFARGSLDLLPGAPIIVLSLPTQGIPPVQDHVPKSIL